MIMVNNGWWKWLIHHEHDRTLMWLMMLWWLWIVIQWLYPGYWWLLMVYHDQLDVRCLLMLLIQWSQMYWPWLMNISWCFWCLERLDLVDVFVFSAFTIIDGWMCWWTAAASDSPVTNLISFICMRNFW